MQKTIYFFIGIVIVGIISTIFIFSSIPSDTWKDWRTGFTGVASPNELDEQNECRSKNGVWKNSGCSFEDKSVQPRVYKDLTKEDVLNLDCGKVKCILGKVTKIIDGNTIVVDDIHVRLALTSTPELDETGGKQARNFAERACPVGSYALIDEDDGQMEGRYGRTIAEIYCDGISLNEWILNSGHGIISTEYCSVSEFASEPWAQKFGCN